MNANRAAQLLEANEQLVLAVIRAQDDAANAARALKEMSRSQGLEALTQRPDGALLFNRLTHAMADARRSGGRLGLLFVSVDNLKDINDRLGHAAGDQALKLAAQRLSTVLRGSDTASRQAGHEFLVLLPALSHTSDALAVADSIIAAMALSGQVGDHEVSLKVSIGISVFPDDGDDGDALIDRATAAMYKARRSGLGSYSFRGEATTPARSLELRLAESLQQPGARAAVGADSDVTSRQREANEQLILAALRTQELLAATELALRHQTEFMGVIAHELRAPLGPISYAAALLGRVKSQEPVLPMVRQVIERQVVQMTRLVADLVDVTRITTGKLTLDVSRMDLARVIEEAAENVRPAIQGRLQELRVEIPPGEVMGNCDRLRLIQVVVNLLGNACKYTQPGGTIGLSVVATNDVLTMSVTDNGIGISPEGLVQVFDPFVQEQHAASFDSSGLGVGLSLVRELVRAHGGQVGAESAGLGLGSRFTVTLPLLPAGT